jgi:two-component sensor histidine kinase
LKSSILKNLGLAIVACMWVFWMVISEAKAQCIAIDSTLTFNDISSKTACFIDSSGSLKLAQIHRQSFAPFAETSFPRFLLSEYRYDFWFRFCLENTSAQPQEFVLSMGDVHRQEYWIDQRPPQLLCHDKRVVANQFDFDHKFLKIKLLKHQKVQVLVKVNDRVGQVFLLRPQVASVAYEHEERLKNLYEERWTFWQNIALKAVLLFVAFFVFVQYYFVRYAFFLFYGFYVLCMMLFHLHGFMYSSYFQINSSFLLFLKFDLDANFYVLITQIFYLLFLREFFNFHTPNARPHQTFFRIQLSILGVLLLADLLCVLVWQRLDYALVLALFTQVFIIGMSIYLLFLMFGDRRFEGFSSIKWASVWLLVGVIWGFVSAYFGWVRTYSILFPFYPNFFFNFCVLAEVFLYAIAIGQLFFRTRQERSWLAQKSAMSELNTLRAQINPHFLFNALNSVKSLIVRQKSDEAVDFLTDLSAYIRTLLHQSREQLLSLEAELASTEAYLNIEKKRFKNAFDYVIIKPENPQILQCFFPALILQPFVENCLKHGFNSLTTNGLIRIEVTYNEHSYTVTIDDNGMGRAASSKLKNPDIHPPSVGTQLIEERLQLLRQLYHWNVQFELLDKPKASGTIVQITVPFWNGH